MAAERDLLDEMALPPPNPLQPPPVVQPPPGQNLNTENTTTTTRTTQKDPPNSSPKSVKTAVAPPCHAHASETAAVVNRPQIALKQPSNSHKIALK